MKKYEENIFDRIKQLSEQKGMSIAEIERKSDLGNGIIRRWDKSIPTADKLQRVAKTLGTNVDFLLTGEDSDNSAEVLARDIDSLSPGQFELIQSMINEFKKSNYNK